MTTINVGFGDMLYVVHWCDDNKRGVRGYAGGYVVCSPLV